MSVPRAVFGRTLLLAVLGLAGLLAPPDARADAVPGPPSDCPAGTQPATCHGGPHCLPTLCKTDADCGDLGPCRTQRMCVDTISCGGLRPSDAPPPPTFEVIRGECSDSCGRCEEIRYCGAKPTSVRNLFGCAAGEGDTSLGLGLALAGALALVLRGRRARAIAGVFALTVLWSGAGDARADVIGPPPASCPAGASPASCHGGPYCAVTTCDASTPCPSGQRCAEVEGCYRQLQCAGDVNPDDLPKYLRWSLDGACAGSCCAKRSICVAAEAPTPTPAASPARACAGADELPLALGLAAVALAVVTRRRACRA